LDCHQYADADSDFCKKEFILNENIAVKQEAA